MTLKQDMLDERLTVTLDTDEIATDAIHVITGQTIKVIFHDEARPINADIAEVQSSAIWIVARTEDVEDFNLADQISIDGLIYCVAAYPMSDGSGFSRIDLAEKTEVNLP